MPEVLPDFLVIGAQKSGTNSLGIYLNAHYDVFIPVRELHYFDENFNKGLNWYREQFAGVTRERVVGEITPRYMYHEAVPALMFTVLPQARLIAILRNPVDRAYSHYWHNRTRGHCETLKFAEAIIAEPKRLSTTDMTTRSRYAYLDRGRYLVQLQRICNYYPREALFVILLEEMHQAPIKTFHSICRFLEIDDTFIPENIGQVKNHFRAVYSTKLQKIIRWLPKSFQEVANRLNTRTTSYPLLDPSIRAKLIKRFEVDNAALAAWLGRDLSVWNR